MKAARERYTSWLKRVKNYHVLLLAIFPVIFAYVNNIGESELSFILAPIFWSLFFALALWLLLKFLLKNNYKTSLAASAGLLLFYSYGHIYQFIEDTNLQNVEVGRHRYFFGMLVLVYAAIYLLVWRAKKDPFRINKFLNVVSLTLMVVSVVNAGIFVFNTRSDGSHNNEISKQVRDGGAQSNGSKRDIYYLIFDRYSSNKTLKEVYGYDNSAFTDEMEKNGFYVAYGSASNYPVTFQSVGSSLNMKYINYLNEEIGEGSSDKKPVFNLIKNNTVTAFLKEEGYRYIHSGSWWGPSAKNPNADINYHYVASLRVFGKKIEFSEFSRQLLETTAFYPFMAYPISIERIGLRTLDNIDELHRRSFEYQYGNFEGITKTPGPKFVFVHFLMPHDPYVYDKTGRPISRAEAIKRGNVKNFLEQIQFVNGKILNMVEMIKKNSSTEPIIIIQADEGQYPLDSARTKAGEERRQRTIREKHRIQNMYYLPDVDMKRALWPSISPVNTFRIIFNEYFGKNLELLPDESYFTPDYEKPYRMENVTELLTDPKK